MARSRKRKAWVVVIDSPRRPNPGEMRFEVTPGVPLAVLPSRTPPREIRKVVDSFVQFFNGHPSEMTAYLTRDGAPYAAETVGRGQAVMGGYSPCYIEAFRVDDLRVVTDPATGEERFGFTRRPSADPERVHADNADKSQGSRG